MKNVTTIDDVILAMLNEKVDCCELTKGFGGYEFTVEISFTKITKDGEVLLSVEETEDEDENVEGNQNLS